MTRDGAPGKPGKSGVGTGGGSGGAGGAGGPGGEGEHGGYGGEGGEGGSGESGRNGRSRFSRWVDRNLGPLFLGGMAFVLVVGFGLGGLIVTRINSDSIDRVNASRLEACNRLNDRFDGIDDAIHTVFDPSANTPSERDAIALFDKALAPENCKRLITNGK